MARWMEYYCRRCREWFEEKVQHEPICPFCCSSKDIQGLDDAVEGEEYEYSSEEEELE